MMKNKFDEQCITPSQMNMIFNMRVFWRRLSTWIRIYIISRYLGVGTAEEAFERLYIENSYFGDALRIPFNRSSSDKYSQLMNQFSIGIRELITARIQGDTNTLRQDIDLLLQNADERAAFLASINPYFDEEEWKNLLVTYLQDTMEEANLFATKDFRMDIEYFDRLIELSNKLGDTFAEGLYDFITSGGDQTIDAPPQEGQKCLTIDQVNALFNIGIFWFDLNNWIRAFMLSRYQSVGNENEVYSRLQKALSDFVSNMKMIFGETPEVNELQLQLKAYIGLIDSLITAQKAGDTEGLDRIIRQLYLSADNIAASLAAINPYWDQSEWKNRLYNQLRSTIEQSTMFLTEDYARNMDVFSMLLALSESSGDYLVQGVLYQMFQSQSQ